MNLLTAAIRAPTLDQAVRSIQRALGITNGDVAASCFSSFSTPAAWSQMSLDNRRRWLGQWLRMEVLHA